MPAKPDLKTLFRVILSDLKVELTDEFDRNFERKGFFDEPWADTKQPVERGSLMMRTGDLRGGMAADIESSESIRWTNTQPYALLHNEGGKIVQTPTAKQRNWAFAMFKQTGLQMYKAMAFTKGDWNITIPKRQFIGDHPTVDKIIKETIDRNINDFFNAQ